MQNPREFPRHAAWITLAAAWLWLAACGAASPPKAPAPSRNAPSTGPQAVPSTAIEIGIPVKSITAAPLYLAQDLGLFAQHGLAVKISVTRPATAMAELAKQGAAGRFFSSAIGSGARAAEKGLPVRVLMVDLDRPPFMLVGQKGLSPSQLDGQTIAFYSPDSTGSIVTGLLLRHLGLQPDAYKVVYAGDDPAHVALLKSGKVAAASLTVSTALPLLAEGYARLGDASRQIELPQDGLVASTAEIRGEPGIVREVIEAVLDATRVATTDTQRAVPVVSREFNLSDKQSSAILQALASAWTSTGKPSDAAVELGLQLDAAALKLAHRPTAADVYDFSLLPSATSGPSNHGGRPPM